MSSLSSAAARLKVTYNRHRCVFDVLNIAEHPMGHSILTCEEISKIGIRQGACPIPGKFHVAVNYSYLDTDRLDPSRHEPRYLLKTPTDAKLIKDAVGKYIKFTLSQDDELFTTFISAFCNVFNISLGGENEFSAKGISQNFPDIEFLFSKTEMSEWIYPNLECVLTERKYAIYSVMFKNVNTPLIRADLVGVTRQYPAKATYNSTMTDIGLLYIPCDCTHSAIVWLCDYMLQYIPAKYEYNYATGHYEYLTEYNQLTIISML